MKRASFFACGRYAQRGMSVVFAVFLLLLMALLAAAMVSLVSTSNATMAADIGGMRAYQAARAGAEWGMFQLDPNAATATLPTCFSSPSSAPVPDYTVSVGCASSDYTEAGRSIRIYRITSTAVPLANKAPGIERVVEVTIEKCRDPAIASAPYDC